MKKILIIAIIYKIGGAGDIADCMYRFRNTSEAVSVGGVKYFISGIYRGAGEAVCYLNAAEEIGRDKPQVGNNGK